MAKIKLEGIILYKTKFQNTSVIFDIFTRKKGRISLIAKGGLREKSKFLGELEYLNRLYIYFYWKENKNIYTLADTDLLESSQFIIENQKIYFKTGELVSFIRRTIPQKESHPEIYNKFLIMLKGIKNKKPYKGILFFFYYFLKYLGWNIFFNEKCECGNSHGLIFLDSSNGRFYCDNCHQGIKLSPSFYNDMKKLVYGEAKNLDISKYKFEEYYNTFKKYLMYHIS